MREQKTGANVLTKGRRSNSFVRSPESVEYCQPLKLYVVRSMIFDGAALTVDRNWIDLNFV